MGDNDAVGLVVVGPYTKGYLRIVGVAKQRIPSHTTVGAFHGQYLIVGITYAIEQTGSGRVAHFRVVTALQLAEMHKVVVLAIIFCVKKSGQITGYEVLIVVGGVDGGRKQRTAAAHTPRRPSGRLGGKGKTKKQA